MLSLTYVSSATIPFSDEGLAQLLAKSRENNASLGVTGMLLHKDGNFIQTLEGPDDVVRALYTLIGCDPRHGGVIRLLEEQIPAPRFLSWSMGFKNLRKDEIGTTPGYSSFLDEPLNSSGFRDDPTRAKKLLDLFRRRM